VTVCGALLGQDDPKGKVTLPTAPQDLARGEKLYRGSCQYCHGPQGDGGKGANLARAKLDRASTDEKLVNVIQNGIPGTEMPGAWHMIDHEVVQVAAFVRTLGKVDVKPVPGDVAQGKAIYAKSGCASCHSLTENGRLTGGLSGPDLSTIGARRSVGHLRESLIDPSASVPEDFLYVTVTTKAGRTITGTRLNEDTFSLLLRDLSGNNHAFPKSTLKDIRKEPKRSPMPSFRDKLKGDDLQNLLAYLVSLKEKS
jgi:cytochrome c oxidase cbb3-type subunit 3